MAQIPNIRVKYTMVIVHWIKRQTEVPTISVIQSFILKSCFEVFNHPTMNMRSFFKVIQECIRDKLSKALLPRTHTQGRNSGWGHGKQFKLGSGVLGPNLLYNLDGSMKTKVLSPLTTTKVSTPSIIQKVSIPTTVLQESTPTTVHNTTFETDITNNNNFDAATYTTNNNNQDIRPLKTVFDTESEVSRPTKIKTKTTYLSL